MQDQQVAVIGAGTMGHGIAQVFAQCGYLVTLVDVVPEALRRAQASIEHSLHWLVEKGKLTSEERQDILARIRPTTELRAAAGAELIVEAIVENASAKRKVLGQIAGVASQRAILASNTSSISITELAGAVPEPERVIGLHFVNPVALMPLVEVVRGLATGQATVSQTVEIVQRLGKTPIVINDAPGFVLNRLLIPMINEAAFVLMEGVADAQAIDAVMKLGANHPMGPLALADLIGLDICLAIMDEMHGALGEDKYRACPLLRRMVSAGHLGRKNGKGFYVYN